jgi:Na+/H+ antiporter NhaA
MREYVATENASAVVLLAATVLALLWANSPWSEIYEGLWSTGLSVRIGGAELAQDLRHWIDDGLMALFFFVVGLEIRREFDMGELRERRRIATPVLAAFGGMVVPALIYLALNSGGMSARGWGIVIGTDTAFALGVLLLVGGSSPRTRAFLLTLVIVDDVFALTVIALAYTDDLAPGALVVAVALLGVIVLLRRLDVRHGIPYFLVGLGVWMATLLSGVHATIAGVVLGVMVTAHPPLRTDLERAGAVWRLFREEPTPQYAHSASRALALTISPNERLQHMFHPWTSLVVVPLFALANAGVRIDGAMLERAATSTITLGILAGLVVGKLVGITGMTWLVTRRRFGGLPMTIPFPPLVGVATVAGIGFTVSLLIAGISFEGPELEEAKLGILAASLIASLLAWVVFRFVGRVSSRPGATQLAPPIRDLSEIVDPEVDHIRGPVDAPVELVEYGDFECPYCGQAETMVRQLLATFGNDLTFVFRHLPLSDVHEHAEAAAEAAEAASAQGKFWEMHDALFQPDADLTYEGLGTLAASLGLDVERFYSDLRERRYALRVTRDLASADDSGAAGTPTFFINGRRHMGRADLATLSAIMRQELGNLGRVPD